jgi:hypothetical protein
MAQDSMTTAAVSVAQQQQHSAGGGSGGGGGRAETGFYCSTSGTYFSDKESLAEHYKRCVLLCADGALKRMGSWRRFRHCCLHGA